VAQAQADYASIIFINFQVIGDDQYTLIEQSFCGNMNVYANLCIPCIGQG